MKHYSKLCTWDCSLVKGNFNYTKVYDICNKHAKESVRGKKIASNGFALRLVTIFNLQFEFP